MEVENLLKDGMICTFKDYKKANQILQNSQWFKTIKNWWA